MRHCYDCFAPTVGAYVLPTALLKLDGAFDSCAAFNVPEALNLGNVYRDGLPAILEEANRRAYIKKVRDGGGLRGLEGDVPSEVTDQAQADGYCDACAFLINASSPVPVPLRVTHERLIPVSSGDLA